MASAAAGGFVTRSLEAMLKECSGKKYPALQKAVQSCLDDMKEIKQEPPSEKSNNEVPLQGEKRDDDSEAENGGNAPDQSEVIAAHPSEETHESITTALATAGRILNGKQAELVLHPLRLAFETKNIKLVDLALDCLHKFIAYDHLEGDPGLENGKNASLFTDILNMVCACVDNSSFDSTILQVLKVLLTAVSSTRFRVHGEPLLGVIRVCYNIALNSKSPINQVTAKAMLTQMISIVFRRMESDEVSMTVSSSVHVDPPSASATSTDNGEITIDDPDEKKLTLGDALSMNRANEESPASVEELQSLAGGADIKGLEAVLDKAVQLEDGKKISRGIDLESMNVGQRDALLLFRTLCKMGMKEESDDVTTKTRLLSLELLQSLLEGVSQSFTKNFHFIDSVKAYLSYALLRASVSPSPVVFQHATGIFTVLLLRFRESLKGEIGVFFPLIILRSLDGSDSSQTHKASVLRMLEKVCKDSQMLADIFVNYDCDLEAPNLFERMVNALSRIAQGTSTTELNSAASSQTTTTKASSLQCLVSVLKSLVDWEKLRRSSQKHSTITSSQEVEVLAAEATLADQYRKEDNLNHFEKAKAHKSTLESAISEFNRKPSKGVEYMLSTKLVENNASSLAQFLKNTPNLDKVMIGEYLGQHEEFPLAVMHAYVESMKFTGLKFDTAIREFLKGFRLPGEAQKIDRIMEKFAERYCSDNPELFKNADTAYVLAYAVIMLNTDAHNPMVWPKMSKSEFVRMNSGSDTEDSAPRELLEEIYDSIVKDEIKMKDERSGISRGSRERPETEERGRLVNILNLALPKRKSGSDTKMESEKIKKQIQDLFRNQGTKRGVFYTAQQVEIVRPMVEAVGWPLLATFSVTMEEGENKPRVLLCMEGFRAGIHITRVLGMDTMRYAFLTSLVRFTFLHAPKEMRSKNVEALRTLFSLCDTETDALQDTWNAVLECVSRLEFITSTPSIAATVMQGSNQISRDSVLQSLRELSGKPAEQVFVNTVKLPSDSIVEFFTALCGVSAEELKQTPARVFSLQKLVEISYYNMARIRLVWARIWSVLAQHFITAGSHYDEKVAMYAIDSLRQLGIKYLERAELTNFTFQNDILKPFVILMRNSSNQKIRSLIVDCIVQMIKSKVGSIKSGWRSVFMIFTAAADDDSEPIIESAFENVEQVILEHFDQVVGDCFMDCVNCLIGFANNKRSARISLKAIALLRICEDRLAEGFIPGGALKPVDDGTEANFDVTEHYWFPMLAGLSDLTLDSRLEVRNCALEVLFDLLNERGHKFSSAFWESIFHRVLFPIFDHVRYAGRDGLVPSGDDWLRETSIHSLQLLCNLFPLMGVSTAAASATLLATFVPRSDRDNGNPRNHSIALDGEVIKRRLLRKGVDPTPKILHALRKKETQKSLRRSKKQALKDDPFSLSESQRQALEEDARFRTAVAEYRSARKELQRRNGGDEREAVALAGRPWEAAKDSKGIVLRGLLGTREEKADGRLKGEHLEELRAMLEERNGERFRWLMEDDVEEMGEDVYDRERTPMKKTPRVVGDEEKIRLLVQRLHKTKINFHDWKFSRLLKQSNLIFTEVSLLKIVQGLGDLGDWMQALDVVEWVYNEKEYKHRKSRFVYTKLLDVLGKARRPDEALQIFNKMQEDGQLYPDMAAYHTIAVTLGQAGLVNELISVIDRMKQKPSKEVRNKKHRDWDPCLKPDVIIYNAVLNACIPSHQWKGVFWVLEQMRHNNLKPTGATYGLAMEVMLRAGKHEFVHKFFDKMQKGGLTPKALTYKVIVRAFWEEGKVTEAVAAVRSMEQRGIVGAASVYYELACCLCSHGLWQDAMLEIEKLKALPLTKPLEVAFTGMILSSLDGGHLSDCVAIFEHMKNHCVPNIGTINAMLKVYCRGDMFAKAKELFEASKAFLSLSKCTQNDPLLELDASSYSYMLKLSASAQQWEYFEYVYKEMLLCGYQLDQRKHVGHLVEASRAGKWHLLEHAFDTLLEAGEIPHVSIFSALICQSINEQNFERATNLLSAMAHASFRVSEIQWTDLIQRDIGEQDIDKLQNLLNHLESRNVIMEEPVPNFLMSLRRICGARLLSDTSSSKDSSAASTDNSAISDNGTNMKNLEKDHDPPPDENGTLFSLKNEVSFMDPRSQRTADDVTCSLSVETKGGTLDLMQHSDSETSVTDAALDLLTIRAGTPFSGMPSASEILDKWRQERMNDGIFSC